MAFLDGNYMTTKTPSTRTFRIPVLIKGIAIIYDSYREMSEDDVREQVQYCRPMLCGNKMLDADVVITDDIVITK